MSAELAWEPLPQQPETEQAPARKLRALGRPAKRRRPTIVSALIAVGFAALVAVAQMSLSLATTQDSFALANLRAEQRELTLQAQSLEAQLTGLSSPQYLASNADSLGLVVSGSPGYLRLSDASLVGAGASATGASTVNPNGAKSIGNVVVADTPLVANPSRTIQGPVAPVVTQTDAEAAGDAATPETVVPEVPSGPQPLETGLPSPSTH